MRTSTSVAILILAAASISHAGDWPMWRADAARSGFTAESLPNDLSLAWSYQPAQPPERAWPRSQKQQFDACFQPVIAGGRLLFGSSADCRLTCLNAATGELIWSFHTGGPIRFAPVMWADRAAVASDDGYLYVLDATDGSVIWRHRGGPTSEMRLGNNRMISKWPARGGPVLIGDVLYYAAGIWPSDGIFIYALDAATGKELWSNKDSGGIYMPQPHGGANAESGLAAQGHLAGKDNRLFVPTGRAVPAGLDRKTGELAYFHLQQNRAAGGTDAAIIGPHMINGGIAFDAESGQGAAPLGGVSVTALADGMATATANEVRGRRWVEARKPNRKGELVDVIELATLWTVKGVSAEGALIAAGRQVVAGGDGRVTVVDARDAAATPIDDRVVWSAAVEGVAEGLAVADERLYASTDRGVIYCFAAGPQDAKITTPSTLNAFGESSPKIVQAVEEILRRTKTTQGFCLDFGCGDGQLAYELAKQTDFTIIAVDDDAQKVARARQRLTAAGLYGTRVTVLEADLSHTGLPRYFANVIVSQRALTESDRIVENAEVRRLQRPYGGLVCAGKLGDMKLQRRGALAGAGNWTHQYSNPANTVCSDDELISGDLGILWFRDIDLPLPQRHGRGPAPLFYQGHLLHEGLDEIRAVDAYNGRQLWSYQVSGVLRSYDGDHLMGTAGTGSNFCVGQAGVFVRHRDFCTQIDTETGQPLREFGVPGRDGKRDTDASWGYIASEGDLLFGTRSDPEHVVTYRYRPGGDLSQQLTESNLFFAYSAETGDLLWQYKAEHSIRHNAIAIGSKYVYLIDRPMAEVDRTRGAKPDADGQPLGLLVALDKRTGAVAWRQDEDIYGTTLAVSDKHDVVVMSYQDTRFKLASEIGGALSAFDAASGKTKWKQSAKYQSRLTINDRTIYADGGAWDLLTGEAREFNFRRSYGCGVLSASKEMFFFRSATLGYFDLTENDKVRNFGGVRPGCWINAIPAGGLVLVPDASAGCTCSYLNQSWFALVPDEK